MTIANAAVDVELRWRSNLLVSWQIVYKADVGEFDGRISEATICDVADVEVDSLLNVAADMAQGDGP